MTYTKKSIITLSIAFSMLFVGGYTLHAQEEASMSAEVNTEAEARDEDSDGDGVESDTEAEAQANYNNSRSNRSTVRDTDADGDGYGDVTVTKELDKATPQAAGGNGDTDGDGYGDVERHQEMTVTKQVDKSTPRLYQALGIDQSSPLLYTGVRAELDTDCDDGDDDCDDGDTEETPTVRDVSIHVSGQEVRGWNPEQKEAVQARVIEAGEVTSANDFGILVAQAALENEDVVEVETTDEETAVRYETRVRFFGFIPTDITAIARAQSEGDVRVEYPWYAFLASKGDASVGSSLAAEIRTAHDLMIASQ